MRCVGRSREFISSGKRCVTSHPKLPSGRSTSRAKSGVCPTGRRTTVSDNYLRNEFPPPGRAKKAARPGDTPTDRYNTALEALGNALNEVELTFIGLTRVAGDDGQPLVDVRGGNLADGPLARPLNWVDEEMIVWARTFRKKWGTTVGATVDYVDTGVENADPYATNGDHAGGSASSGRFCGDEETAYGAPRGPALFTGPRRMQTLGAQTL